MVVRKKHIVLIALVLISVSVGLFLFMRQRQKAPQNSLLQQVPTQAVSNSAQPHSGGNTPPHKITNLKASIISDKEVKLIWAPVGENTGMRYIVYRAEGDGVNGNAEISYQTKPLTTTEYRDTTLKPSTSYYYYVKAVDEKGNESEASNIAGGKTKNTDPAENVVMGNLSGELGVIIPDATIIVTIVDKNDPTKKIADPYRVRLVNRTGSYIFKNLPTKVYLLKAKTEQGTPLYESVQTQHTATFPTKDGVGEKYGRETLKKTFNFKKVSE